MWTRRGGTPPPAAVVDPERLHRLLRRVSDDLAVLRAYGQVPAEELLPDPARLGHVKYLFVTMLEGCIGDVANDQQQR